MQIIRRASFVTTPWKNGGGITHEAIRVPAGGGPFRWRLSIAELDSSGPFSDFAGYDRKMVLLRGAGLRLTFDAAAPVVLSAVGDLAEFDGALETHCELLDGPCVDLNLMVAGSGHGVTASVQELRTALALPASRPGITLVFGITGTLLLDMEGQAAVSLHPWDLAIVPAGAIGTVAPLPAPSALVFFASLDDNSL